MKILALVLALFTTAAVADTPAPAGLGDIQARYAGTWNITEEAYATDFSRPGNKQYEITRDCTPTTGAVLDCKLMAQGILQGEQRFTWDAASGIYHVDMDIGGRPQPSLTLTVKGASWSFLQAVPGPDGKPMQLRILRQYRSSTEVSYSASYSRDGVNWTLMTHGTEIRKDTAK
jgi:hypothetical protein